MIHFRLNKIGIDQFAVLTDTVPEGDGTLNTAIEFQYAPELQMVACTVTFRFINEGNQFMVLGTRCEFLIKPEDWDAQVMKDGEVILPQDLLEILAVHTVGTSRGILFCKTEGTPFNVLMIPPINVHEILSQK